MSSYSIAIQLGLSREIKPNHPKQTGHVTDELEIIGKNMTELEGLNWIELGCIGREQNKTEHKIFIPIETKCKCKHSIPLFTVHLCSFHGLLNHGN